MKLANTRAAVSWCSELNANTNKPQCKHDASTLTIFALVILTHLVLKEKWMKTQIDKVQASAIIMWFYFSNEFCLNGRANIDIPLSDQLWFLSAKYLYYCRKDTKTDGPLCNTRTNKLHECESGRTSSQKSMSWWSSIYNQQRSNIPQSLFMTLFHLSKAELNKCGGEK